MIQPGVWTYIRNILGVKSKHRVARKRNDDNSQGKQADADKSIIDMNRAHRVVSDKDVP